MNTILSPEEIRRNKLAKKPIRFSILVCGQSVTGKKTFVNTLCNKQFFKINGQPISPGEEVETPENEEATESLIASLVSNNDLMSIGKHHLEIHEPNSAPISLNVILTPGFGEAVNNERCSLKIVDYIETQFNLILQEECRIKRNPKFTDGRIHVALYFISATSKGLSQLDVESMKLLSNRVNLIPIISKADLLTKDESNLNKKIILKDIKHNNIPIYDFSRHDFEEEEGAEETQNEGEYDGQNKSNQNFTDDQNAGAYDEILSDQSSTTESSENQGNSDDSYLNDSLPFAVIGSNSIKELNDGKKVHTRKYDWAEVNIEDPNICDFNVLKTVLFGSHLQEFKDVTHNILYERYRTEKLLIRNMYAEINK